MKKPEQSSSEFVVCINNAEYPASLELHKIYRVVPDTDAAADADIRIIDESGEDYLYPACNFSPISAASGGRILASGLLIQNRKKGKKQRGPRGKSLPLPFFGIKPLFLTQSSPR
jgi:hypothetical protein